MPQAKGAAYESLVRDLVAGICRGTTLQGYVLGSGAGNRIAGASGYGHQIDLSLIGPNELFLFELKCLKKPIGVAALLILASRRSDIAAKYPHHTVHASMVSMKRPSKNVAPLAHQFSVNVDVVTDLQSYGLAFANQHFVGCVASVQASDSVDAQVIRANNPRAQ